MDTGTSNITLANITNCIPSDLIKVMEIAAIISYGVITPLHILFGLPATMMAVYVFYKNRTKESGYRWQFLAAINSTFYLLAYTTSVACSVCTGAGGLSQEWFMRSYYLMWWMVHASFELVDATFLNVVLFSLNVAADRTLAMTFPLKYKNLNHGIHRKIAFSVALSISLLVVLPKCWLVNIEKSDDLYVLSLEDHCGLWCQFVGYAQSFLLMTSALCLFTVNVLMVNAYRKRNKKIGQMTSNHNFENEARRKLTEKTLIILTSWESIAIFTNCVLLSAYYTAPFGSDWFLECGFRVYQPMLDGALELLDLLKFYILFVASRQFRELVFEAVPRLNCLKRFWGTTTATVTT